MGEAIRQRIETIAKQVRRFLEPRWEEWHRHEGSPRLQAPSQGTCGRSSLFLREVLRAEGLMAEFVAGSPSEGQEGYWLGGAWHGHAWVEVEGWIVDVTADQFGAPPVIVSPVGISRYRAGVDASEPQFLARRQKVARELMNDWMEKREEDMEHAIGG
ncbi:transglutaminase domain-containing protein [Thalassovita sp.]|uniref:transglutaminase domain-containing protein n=1 Tax=Thalassovita sp. TaxID=1979401 RepID=UPI0029DE8B6D|nr:transglutaminase domain-containing protein [Thalassovita sp.]